MMAYEVWSAFLAISASVLIALVLVGGACLFGAALICVLEYCGSVFRESDDIASEDR